MGRVIFHIDIDAFFASVEQSDNPELAGKPVIVGAAPGHRGVVSTCSYEARAFGVHSAMPVSEAYRLCPQGIFLPVRMSRYCGVSAQVMEIMKSYSPDFRQVSVDEAFLDMTGTERLWGLPHAAAERLRSEVHEKTKMSVSIGIASNHYVAKIASGLEKPSGLVEVFAGTESAFMKKLPLEKLWGAGGKTRARILDAGIFTVADLARWPQEKLEARFGAACGVFLYQSSHGIDPGMMSGEAKSRSMSTERTFDRDCCDSVEVSLLLRHLSDELAFRLWDEGMESRTLVLKLRYSDFTTISRRISRSLPYASADETYSDATALL
ncbi:MAG: DNA polymerase IV, partial [Rectinemataceae bacterium]|nr:DNA polymerase IV [Rectinemataceae bacterium]